MTNNTKEIKSKDSEGTEVVLYVTKPTAKDLKGAQLHAMQAFNTAIANGALTREQINDYMRSNGYWDDEKQAKLEDLSKRIREGERQLLRGGKTLTGEKFTKVQARELALNMRTWRMEQLILLSKQRELDEFTVQGQAENAKFDYLVVACTKDEEGNKVFKDVEDYYEKQEEPYTFAAAQALANINNDLDPDFEKKYTENKFLVAHGFARETDLRLVNADGHLVDSKGNLVNEDGKYINEDEELVDRFGNRVDEEGNPVEDETFEFED